MGAVGRLGRDGWGGRLSDRGCILGDGGELLLAKGRSGRAGSLLPLTTLILTVGSLTFYTTNGIRHRTRRYKWTVG